MNNQNSNADKDKPKILIKIQKKEQVRFKKYWKKLQSQNRELIHTMTQEMKETLAQVSIQNIQTLKLLLLEPEKIVGIIPKLKQLFNELMKMLKGAILNALNNLPASQREFYEEITKMNLQLVEHLRKTKGYTLRFSKPTIEELFHLDVASLLLKQNQIFKKEWWHFENLWTEGDLQEISLIYTKALHLYRKHQYYSDYLRYNNSYKKINDIVTILALVRIRIRLANFLKQTIQHPYLLEIEKERQQRQRAERQKDDNKPDIRFNFSQLANLLIQNQLQYPPSNCKAQFYQIIRSIMNQRSLRKKKYLILFAKIKYSVSIQAILQNLSHFQQMDEQQFMQNFQQALSEENLAKSEEVIAEMMCNNYMQFRDKWKYIFLKDYSFQEAFEKSGLKEQNQAVQSYNKIDYIRHCQQYYLLAASLSCFSDYTQYSQKLLDLESLTRSLIIIKKYELTYLDTRTGSIAEQQTEDQSRTLILATVNSKVLFFYLLDGEVSPVKYFQKIKEGIKQNAQHSKFTVILFQQDFKQHYTKFLKETYKFVKYLAYCYDSRAYLFRYSKYLNSNIFNFTKLSWHLKKISKKVTKQKIYEILGNIFK